MPLEDRVARRRVEHEISKHDIDFSLGSVAVLNGTAYIGGRVKHMHTAGGRNMDLKKEMAIIADAIRTLPDVRDVVLDCDYG
jgi:hypothetical protein